MIELKLDKSGDAGVIGHITLPAGLSGTFQWAGKSIPLVPGKQPIDVKE